MERKLTGMDDKIRDMDKKQREMDQKLNAILSGLPRHPDRVLSP